jgi:hypothetical protein
VQFQFQFEIHLFSFGCNYMSLYILCNNVIKDVAAAEAEWKQDQF